MERIRKIVAVSRVSNIPTPAQVRALVLGVALGCDTVEMLCLRTGMLGGRSARRSETVPAASMLGAMRIDPFVTRPSGSTLPAVVQTQEAAGVRDLAQLIGASNADLVVADNQDEGFFSQLISGYSLDDLLAASRRPLLVVKRPARLPYHKLLIATDFSAPAEAAARAALAVAPRAQATFLHVLEAQPAPVRVLPSLSTWRKTFAPQQAQETARHRLDALIAGLGPRRQLLSRAVACGPVAEVAAAHIDRLMPDLLAIGASVATTSETRHAGRLMRWLREQEEVDVLIAQAPADSGGWGDRPAA